MNNYLRGAFPRLPPGLLAPNKTVPHARHWENFQQLKKTFLCGLSEKHQVEVQIEDMEVARLLVEVVHLDPYPNLRNLQEVFCSGYEKTKADGSEAAR